MKQVINIADKSGITSTAYKMLGLAIDIPVIQNEVSKCVHITIQGNVSYDAGVKLKLKSGTGTAPNNGDAETGTDCTKELIHTVFDNAGGSALTQKQAFTLNAVISDSSTWADIVIKSTDNSTVSITDVTVIVNR